MMLSPVQVLLRNCSEGGRMLSSLRVTAGLSREWKSLSELPGSMRQDPEGWDFLQKNCNEFSCNRGWYDN